MQRQRYAVTLDDGRVVTLPADSPEEASRWAERWVSFNPAGEGDSGTYQVELEGGPACLWAEDLQLGGAGSPAQAFPLLEVVPARATVDQQASGRCCLGLAVDQNVRGRRAIIDCV